MSPDLDTTIQSGADAAFAELDLVDLNVVLHRADGEEKDATGESLCFFFLSSSHMSESYFAPCGSPISRVSPITTPSLLPRLLSSSRITQTDFQAATESTRSPTTDH